MADDSASVIALVEEVAARVQAKAYKPESRGVFCSKAWHSITSALGDKTPKEPRDFTSIPDHEAVPAFVAALQQLEQLPGQRLGLRGLAERAIQTWCRQHDPYSKYIRAADLRLADQRDKPTGSGIGMSILEKKDEGFLCYPLYGSPAELAGIKPGDKLLSVDGQPLAERPLEYLAAVIRGEPGTEVSLRIERTGGRAQTLRVTRETLTSPSVIMEKTLSGMVLRVRKFNAELPKEARAALSGLSPGAVLTIDLCGCGGGDVDRAVEFAGMFLEPGEPILTIQYRDKVDVRRAQNAREFKPAAIILL
ncbi:MAG: S41 family peptidase [Roseimicrobium sp.]